jgi:hypothetical protein
MKITLVVKNATIFQCEYTSFAFVHLVEVMADLKPNKIT